MWDGHDNSSSKNAYPPARGDSTVRISGINSDTIYRQLQCSITIMQYMALKDEAPLKPETTKSRQCAVHACYMALRTHFSMQVGQGRLPPKTDNGWGYVLHL